MPGVTESEVVAFFHANRAAAKRKRDNGAACILAAIERRYRQEQRRRYRDWQANEKAARDAYERGLE